MEPRDETGRLQRLFSAFGKEDRSTRGRAWTDNHIFRCPACAMEGKDHSGNNLHLRYDDKSGVVLLNCFGHHASEDILSAAGLCW